jgi:hypothetical protein
MNYNTAAAAISMNIYNGTSIGRLNNGVIEYGTIEMNNNLCQTNMSLWIDRHGYTTSPTAAMTISNPAPRIYGAIAFSYNTSTAGGVTLTALSGFVDGMYTAAEFHNGITQNENIANNSVAANIFSDNGA